MKNGIILHFITLLLYYILVAPMEKKGFFLLFKKEMSTFLFIASFSLDRNIAHQLQIMSGKSNPD